LSCAPTDRVAACSDADGFHGRGAPDERAILVANRRRIGLIDPRTGQIDHLGSLGCGYITSAVWTPRPPG
jgi:hypothetical protein